MTQCPLGICQINIGQGLAICLLNMIQYIIKHAALLWLNYNHPLNQLLKHLKIIGNLLNLNFNVQIINLLHQLTLSLGRKQWFKSHQLEQNNAQLPYVTIFVKDLIF